MGNHYSKGYSLRDLQFAGSRREPSLEEARTKGHRKSIWKRPASNEIFKEAETKEPVVGRRLVSFRNDQLDPSFRDAETQVYFIRNRLVSNREDELKSNFKDAQTQVYFIRNRLVSNGDDQLEANFKHSRVVSLPATKVCFFPEFSQFFQNFPGIFRITEIYCVHVN